MAAAKKRRCATYTRKSSEEGLEQDFNSLDAQREACEAFIRSQKSEGWSLVRTRYDDGGYSGGTLDRPALHLLLEDIEAGKVDTVVVYKVDRLTRSLADFAKIVEVLDAHEASFVSVTQQFNTTTSMGRLTLNMLLSFAQFEREVTGERIRDKIAASKRKGLWMGGPVPLGYEPDGRTLTIVESEAETVRTVFRLYLEHGSVRLVKEAADRLRLTTKVREDADRHMSGGRPLSRGHIYRLLGNPLYIGRIAHNGESFEGQHPAIIDPETWNSVQKQLEEQAPPQSSRGVATHSSPLRGKLFDQAGNALTPSHSVKSGRRYRYYVSRNALPAGAEGDGSRGQTARWRLPAREIERLVGSAALALLGCPSELARVARASRIEEAHIPALIESVERWDDKPLGYVQRVDLRADEMTIHLDLSSVVSKEGFVIRDVIPINIRRRGVEMRLILARETKGSMDTRVDPALVKAIVRARRWFEQLANGEVTSFAEIAKAEGVSQRYVGRSIPLAFLAPDVISNVLTGTQPIDLTAEELTKRIDLPLAWAEQKKVLGLD